MFLSVSIVYTSVDEDDVIDENDDAIAMKIYYSVLTIAIISR